MSEAWSMRLLLALGLAGTLLAGSAPGQQQPARELLQVGEPLPSLWLPTLDGSSSIDLGSLRGRKLLLIQFASW